MRAAIVHYWLLNMRGGEKVVEALCRLLPDADITVKFAENHWASLTCGRSRTRIAGMSRESFPELPAMPETVAHISVKQLTAMITRTMFAISMEESRFTLNGALLILKETGLVMVSISGFMTALISSGVGGRGVAGQPAPCSIRMTDSSKVVSISWRSTPARARAI